MNDVDFYDAGFEELEEMLSNYVSKVDNVTEILQIGAKAFVDDVRKLPKPRSSVSKSGYTHLLDTITYKKTKTEVEAGWGKYYGPMVEKGTTKMRGTPHFATTFQRNKEKYYKLMIQQGGL